MRKTVIKKVKPYNAGTMTSAAFWSFIRSALRQKSVYWKPIAVAKNKARRPYKGPYKRRKYEYQCNKCKQWFSGDDISIDHILPAGKLNCYNDLPGFVERLFCEADGLQCLCSNCHDIKTKNEKL